MSVGLHTLKSAPGAKKRTKRLGRGNASRGTYSGRGIKGQRARSGGKRGLKLLGMKQMLLSVPKKKGFTSPHEKARVITTGQLEKHYEVNEIVSRATLQKKGLARPSQQIKIVLNGALSKTLTIHGCAISKGAANTVTAAGGKIEK